jgi:hypothetical protein
MGGSNGRKTRLFIHEIGHTFDEAILKKLGARPSKDALIDSIDFYRQIYPNEYFEGLKEFGPGLMGPDQTNKHEFPY